jgi:hypothetical protein
MYDNLKREYFPRGIGERAQPDQIDHPSTNHCSVRSTSQYWDNYAFYVLEIPFIMLLLAW